MSLDQRRRLLAAVQAHARPALRGGSLWIGHPGVKLRAADGAITEAGRRYEAMVAERGGARRYEHAGYAPPQARTEYRNGAEFIEDRDGRMREARRWDASLNGGRGAYRFTPYGRSIGHDTVRYIVDVPVIARFLRRKVTPRGVEFEWSPPYRTDRTGEPFMVPITSDRLGDIAPIGDLREVHNVGDHERQKRFITDAVTRYLLVQPLYAEDEILLQAYQASDALYTFDAAHLGDWRHFRFSEEVVSYHRHGDPTVETILNRPLRGEHRLPAEFLWKMDLIPEAMLPFDGRCCSHQLVRAVRRRSQAGGSGRKNAQEVFSLEDVEALLDDLEFELYPGVYEPPNAPVLSARSELEAYAPLWGPLLDSMDEADNLEVRPHVEVPYEVKRELEAYIPLWTGGGNERDVGFITRKRPVRQLHDLKTAVDKANLTKRSDLPSLAAVLKRHGITLRQYFELFPDTFRVFNGRVVFFDLSVDDDIVEQRSLPKAEPYRREGWRQVGVTSHLIAGLARRLGRPVHVVHNDQKVFTFKPDDWDEAKNKDDASALVYNIWGDHAFFYRPGKGEHAANLAARPLVEVPERCLAVHAEHRLERVPFHEQRQFDIDEVVRYYDCAKAREACDWSGHWYTFNIKDAARALSERGLSYYPRYVSPHKFTSVTIKAELRDTGRRITISELPEHYDELAEFCRVFSEQTRYRLEYHGESMSVVGQEAMRAMFVTKRVHCDRDALAERQKTCVCGDPLSNFEVHHRQPVDLGGSSDIDNLVALCTTCHAVETDRQRMSGALSCGFESQLSPRLTEIFLDTPKPKQWHQGRGVDRDVNCLDVCGCRRNALVHSRLPVFGPADELEVFDGDVDGYDYFWVRCDKQLDEYDSMLYDGEHLYPWVSVDYMLESYIISLSDVKYAIKASRRFEGFPEAVDAIRAAWEAVGVDNTKLMMNSTIGLFNQRDRSKWTVRETGVFDDMGRVDVIASEGDELPKCAAHTQVVGPETCYPIGLIALHWESCTVHRAVRELQSIDATIHGVCVDGVFYTGDEQKVDIFIDSYQHPNGEPVYAKKVGKWQCCPRNPQSRDDHDREFIEQPRLVEIHDDRDAEHLADLVVANGGALITGPAGTGKTVLNRLVNHKLEGQVVNTAMTHAASRLMPNGKTLAHVLHSYRYGRVAGVTFCIDEIGMVPLSTLVRVGAWQLVGAQFVMLGDFRGQFEPICDHWRGADVETSGIVRQLAKGLHIHLSTNRRAAGDDAHFRFYTGLYAKVGAPVPLVEARAAYPLTTEICDLALVVSHQKRRRLNQYYNEARDRRDGVLVKCAAGVRHHNQPQDMWLRPGMRLVCCCKIHPALVNGVFYVVEKADKEEVVVRMDESYRRDRSTMDDKAAKRADRQEGDIALTHVEASLNLRLTHALCYATVQGLTIRDKRVLMLDLEHPHFSVRSLIVGLSRVTKGSHVHVATREQEEKLMSRTRPVPPPPTAVAVEESDSDEE